MELMDAAKEGLVNLQLCQPYHVKSMNILQQLHAVRGRLDLVYIYKFIRLHGTDHDSPKAMFKTWLTYKVQKYLQTLSTFMDLPVPFNPSFRLQSVYKSVRTIVCNVSDIFL